MLPVRIRDLEPVTLRLPKGELCGPTATLLPNPLALALPSFYDSNL